MNDVLVTRLDSVDERLLEYLDKHGEMSADTVRRMRQCTTRLLDGSLSPVALAEDWPDWYRLVPAFVEAYVHEDIEVMEEEEVQFLAEAVRNKEDVVLADDDRDYLTLLALQLDMYPELRGG